MTAALRSLDREVATRVLGWRQLPDRNGGTRWVQPGLPDEFNLLACPLEPPSFSESIADAWLVVERMREKGWHLDLGASGRRDTVNAHFSRWTSSKLLSGDAGSDSAPEAICRAALQAVGEAERP